MAASGSQSSPPVAGSAGASDNASSGEQMKNIWLKIALLVLLCGALGFELWHLRSSSGSAPHNPTPSAHKPDFALLPATEIAAFNNTYGKLLSLGVHVQSWEPTLGDMQEAEDELPQISKLTNKNLDSNAHIEASQYMRQYLAIAVDGENLLFVNGLCPNPYGANNDWRKRLTFVNDGGPCHWQAIYNPSTHTFADSELTVGRS